MDSTPAATFEELPHGDAVLRRVTRDGSPPTFMVQFTWDFCEVYLFRHTAFIKAQLGGLEREINQEDGGLQWEDGMPACLKRYAQAVNYSICSADVQQRLPPPRNFLSRRSILSRRSCSTSTIPSHGPSLSG